MKLTELGHVTQYHGDPRYGLIIVNDGDWWEDDGELAFQKWGVSQDQDWDSDDLHLLTKKAYGMVQGKGDIRISHRSPYLGLRLRLLDGIDGKGRGTLGTVAAIIEVNVPTIGPEPIAVIYDRAR